jgi:hypothetical protein
VISVNWQKLLGEFGDLAKAYERLPARIAKKHLLASMRRSIQKAKGPSLLRQNTPPIGLKRGRKAKGAVRKGSTGELRKSVMTKAKWIGTNKGGFAVAGLGYRYGWNSRKAIWNEYGTKWQKGVGMMQRTFDSIRGPVAANLASELAAALEKAAAEVGGGKNKGYGG